MVYFEMEYDIFKYIYLKELTYGKKIRSVFVVNEKEQPIQLVCSELEWNLKVHAAMKCAWVKFQEPFKEKDMYISAHGMKNCQPCMS